MCVQRVKQRGGREEEGGREGGGEREGGRGGEERMTNKRVSEHIHVLPH